ncbi:MAG: DUF4143 domain-containing protein [Propionibacteriaceae bacterium]|jgi:predicted AAA+ superfamily ATPase|nr:DUF4143 domain-containing protein [Propionibacteriaceae bacterium]
MEYRPRVADADLSARLRRSGAVLVEGAKGCGKTWLASQAAASTVRVDVDPNVEAFMEVDPDRLLLGETPRLIDEWQMQPRLWNHIRRAIDDRGLPGQFILTGSATPDDDVRRHSGAGRFSVMRLRPMSLWESGHSTGEISLEGIRRGEPIPTSSDTGADLETLAELVIRGGWPSTLGWPLEDAGEYVRDYLDLLVNVDINRVSDAKRDPSRVRRLLSSIARNTATEVSISTLTRDTGGDGDPLNRETAAAYLDALELLMVTDNQPAWSTALRDSATLRKSPKRHLVDPSLAAAALGATKESLLREPKTLGTLFESLVIRDLRVYAAAHRGEVFHYRDSADREIDAIIAYPDGWIACEIKLGVGAAEKAAENLKQVASTIDSQTVGEPDARLVITGTGPNYRRSDRVVVLSIATMKH